MQHINSLAILCGIVCLLALSGCIRAERMHPAPAPQGSEAQGSHGQEAPPDDESIIHDRDLGAGQGDEVLGQ